MRDLLLSAAGLLLLIFLCTEEFQSLARGLQRLARGSRRSRYLAYCLAGAAVLAGGALAINAVLALVRAVWSYN